MIVTFYSFKGGTGRTMALANIAILLAKAGKRVLAVDFDLEAPGLWRFFQDLTSGLDRREGLLDMLTSQSKQAIETPVDWREYVTPVTFDEGWISLMTSGRSDSHYMARALDFNWQQFFRYKDGGSFIEHLRAEWAEEYDFVLIDSRTGITDTGGVCTISLPDLIVPILVANNQNIEGILEVLSRAQDGRQKLAYDRSPALILPILSRFDSRTEYRTASEWLDLLAAKLAHLYADWLPKSIPPRKILERTKLPYVAYYSFGEKLPVLNKDSSDPESLGYALGSVARLIESHLRDVAPVMTDKSSSLRDMSIDVSSDEPSWEAPHIEASLSKSDKLLATNPAIMAGVPPLNPNFTGREELLIELRKVLRRQSRGVVLPVTLQGLSGVGKSQLAIEYAHRFQADYELIWWIPSEDDLSIRRALVSLARRLQLPEADDISYTIEVLLDQLRIGRPTPNWLLIYDGAGEPIDLRKYLPSGPGSILITSRSRSWVNHSTVIELDVFTSEESVAFLTRRWTDISVEEARVLADELGFLPLALEQAVAVHMETGMPLYQYLHLLRASPGHVLTDDYEHSVAKTLRLAFAQLSDQSPAAAQLLQVCSFLSSHPIALPMLVRGRGASLPPEISEALHDDMKMRRAVRDLARYALAQLDANRDTIVIHKLVRALIRDGMDPELRIATERSAHELLALANPGMPDNEQTWPQHAQIAPHVVPSGVIMSKDPHVRRIVVDQMRYLFVIGNYADSVALAERVIEEWGAKFGAEDEMSFVVNLHLGNALRALGEYARAREINKATLRRAEHILGFDHEYTLRIANSLAADLRLLGSFGEASRIDEVNLERYRSVLGEDDVATLRSANNLAVDYRLLGDFSKAQEIGADTLQRRRLVLAPQSPEIFSSENSIVYDLYGLGEYEKALALAQEILTKHELPVNDHAFVLPAKRNLAILLRKTGNYTDAVSLSESNLESARSRLGERHELSLSSMMTLSNALRVHGDLARARSVSEHAFDIYRAQFGDTHPFTLACAVNVAIVLRTLGGVEEATELDRRSLERLERVLGANHPDTLCAASNMSNNLAMMGEAEEARQISQTIYERSQRVRGLDHPYTLACAANFALALDATGVQSEAAKLRGETLDRLRRTLGPEHPDIVNVERGRRAECDIEVPQT